MCCHSHKTCAPHTSRWHNSCAPSVYTYIRIQPLCYWLTPPPRQEGRKGRKVRADVVMINNHSLRTTQNLLYMIKDLRHHGDMRKCGNIALMVHRVKVFLTLKFCVTPQSLFTGITGTQSYAQLHVIAIAVVTSIDPLYNNIVCKYTIFLSKLLSFVLTVSLMLVVSTPLPHSTISL